MRVLIATATAGGGHLQAAAAIEEAWRLKYPADTVKRLDILDFTPRLYRKAYAEGYVRLAEKVPELYAHAFRISDNPAFVKRIALLRRMSARWLTRKFIRTLNDFRPDVIVCPHFLPLEAMGAVQKQGLKIPHPKVVCVVTDFEAHALWMESCVDRYCVAMESTKARLVARRVPSSKISVTGIPISQRFVKPPRRAASRRELRLHPKLPAVLVLGGGMGMGPLVETLEEMDRSQRDFQMIAVTGKNEALRKKLAGRRFKHPTQVFGFVTNMQDFMTAADLIVTKPGGLTTSEALALGKPLLIVNPLPGQEAANSDFLLEGGAAIKANRLEDLRFRIDQALGPQRLARLAKAAKALGRPRAAERVCKAARTLLLLGLAVCATASAVRADCSVRADEEMLIFPTSAPWPETGKPWTAEIHGWMFKPEKNSVLRAALMKSVMKTLGIPKLSGESDLFKKRMNYFLVDNEQHRPVSCILDGQAVSVAQTNAGGHFDGFISLADLKGLSEGKAGPVAIRLQGCEKNVNVPSGQLWLVPRKGISVISDIDDTIKVSNVGDAEALMLNTFMRPYEAVEGMAALYTGWAHAGAVIHYLSASPWPLYPTLDEFLRTSGFPAGPVVMKPFRVRSRSVFALFQDPMKYKLPLIRDLLKLYPEREFVLIGDSGEKDPEVYGQIAREFGSQVRVILIRNLHPEFDGQTRYRKAFRGLPEAQWSSFTTPHDIQDGLTRTVTGVKDEWNSVLRYREGLQEVMRFVDAKPEIFPPAPLKQARLMSRSEKEILWSTWSRFLEYVLALDSLQSSHVALPHPGIAADRENFLVRYGAFVVEYRWALELLKRLDNDPAFQAILNEPVPEIGLPKGTFDRLKYRFLNLVPAGQFTAMKTVYQALNGHEAPELRAAIGEDEAELWKTGLGRGEVLTFKNGLQMIGNVGFTLWFPVQAGVSEWMGDTKVWRVHASLIQPDAVQDMRKHLLPGDILLERREWYLSNIGLPGYWPHAALYIGSAAERRAYLGDAAENLLEKKYPKAYADSLVPWEGHPPAILEAMSEGVVFTSLEHSCAADSLVVLRPRVSKQEKTQALMRAFHYAGRPYDFNFDFATDSAIVCSELVYKAYEPSPTMKGIHFAWETMLGRQVASPNRMAQQFSEEFGKPDAQLDMILFLDGNERSGRAYPSSVENFCASWKRPKWEIWVQKKPL